jgi:hypothetical protein
MRSRTEAHAVLRSVTHRMNTCLLCVPDNRNSPDVLPEFRVEAPGRALCLKTVFYFRAVFR